MEYLFTSIVNLGVKLIEYVAMYFTNSLIAPMGVDQNLFLAYFPKMQEFFIYIQGIGVLIAIGIFIFQTMKSMFYKFSASQTDSVAMMVIKLVICIGLIVGASGVMSFMLKVGTLPITYSGMNDTSTIETIDFSEAISNASSSTQSDVSEKAEGITLIASAGSSSAINILECLVACIALAFLGWKLIKFLIEILERYILLNVMLFMCPLAFGTGISRSTTSILRKYIEMLLSTFLLMFLNLLMLRLIYGAFNVAFSSTTLNYTFENGTSPNPILSIFIIGSIITIASNLDQHLSKLIVTGTTGSQIGMEALLAGRTLGSLVSKTTGGLSKGIQKVSGKSSTGKDTVTAGANSKPQFTDSTDKSNKNIGGVGSTASNGSSSKMNLSGYKGDPANLSDSAKNAINAMNSSKGINAYPNMIANLPEETQNQISKGIIAHSASADSSNPGFNKNKAALITDRGFSSNVKEDKNLNAANAVMAMSMINKGSFNNRTPINDLSTNESLMLKRMSNITASTMGLSVDSNKSQIQAFSDGSVKFDFKNSDGNAGSLLFASSAVSPDTIKSLYEDQGDIMKDTGMPSVVAIPQDDATVQMLGNVGNIDTNESMFSFINDDNDQEWFANGLNYDVDNVGSLTGGTFSDVDQGLTDFNSDIGNYQGIDAGTDSDAMLTSVNFNEADQDWFNFNSDSMSVSGYQNIDSAANSDSIFIENYNENMDQNWFNVDSNQNTPPDQINNNESDSNNLFTELFSYEGIDQEEQINSANNAELDFNSDPQYDDKIDKLEAIEMEYKGKNN